MRIPALLVLALLLPLAGCLQTRVERLGADYYRMQQQYQTRDELAAAIAHHEQEAAKLCPEGYVKRKDFDRVDGSARVLVWEVGCDRQYRPDNSRTRSPSG